MTNRSRSTLFLIEQLIVIAVFAICAAACIRILTTAYFYASNSNATGNALLAAESIAETYKSFGGDFKEIARMESGFTIRPDGTGYVYYNDDWKVCVEADARFVLNLMPGNPADSFGPLIVAELTVDRITGENLVAFPISAVS